MTKTILEQIPTLFELSYKGLEDQFDRDQNLFAYYVKDGIKVPMPLGWSMCYTTMTVLGFHKARQNGWPEAGFFDLSKVLAALKANWQRIDKFGHLGLLHWVNTECAGIYREEITQAIKLKSTGEFLPTVPTTELAWQLIGLSAALKIHPDNGELVSLAEIYFEHLSANFNPQTDLFCHTLAKSGAFDLRSQIGNFADQIYSVLALSMYYEVSSSQAAVDMAVRSADNLCTLQGSQGQWYWHYQARRGGIVSPYPVFSVHQDGMAPMGLMKLSEVSGKDYSPSVLKGLGWLFRSNELGTEMVDIDRLVIWRDIERSPSVAWIRYISMLLMELNLTAPLKILNSEYSLKLNREMRPYELGWLLYGLSFLKIPRK